MPASKKVLIVEDEEDLRTLLGVVLQKAGYEIRESSDAEEAFGIFEKEGGFQLLLADVILKEKSGIELAHAIREKDPAVKVIFTSGYPDYLIKENQPDCEGCFFLPKPFFAQDLTAMVGEVLSSGGMPHTGEN